MLEIRTLPRFDKRYRKLAKPVKESAKKKERIFRENPHDPALETHKLHGKDRGAWAFSIDRKYRIKFIFLSETEVLFLDVGTHAIYG